MKNYISKTKFNSVLIILIIIIFIVLYCIYIYGTRYSKTITVEHIYHFSHSDRGGSNTIYDTNDNVYIVQNQILYMFFTSAELFNYFKIDKKYKITGYGWRIPILNLYPNILSVQEI